MAASVALFAYGGYLLDGWTGTEPLFFVIGALLGIFGGTIHLLLVLAPETLPFGRRKPRASDDDEKSRSPADPEHRNSADDTADR